MTPYLQPTAFFDYDHPVVARWVREVLEEAGDNQLERIQKLYLAVRDGVRYNPYGFRLEARTFSASYALQTGESYCIPKAVLLGAAARSIGIPSRLGLADVRNHLSSPRLIEWLRSDIFRMHGYIELFLNGQWVKATPAFNAALCEAMNVAPLEFDGTEDSLFQEYTESGAAHMEYISDHGTFDDLPHEFIVEGIRRAYSHLFDAGQTVSGFDGSLESDLDGH